MICFVLASGQSLTAEQVDLVRGARDRGLIDSVITVSNVGLDLAPWADALVSHDEKWWAHHTHSNMFEGRKFCRTHWPNVEVFIPNPSNGCNSGYMAMQVARDIYKAEKIVLLGFDMHGTHYFGEHKTGLTNTGEAGFNRHIKQFEGWHGCEVVNCTPNSALKKFPFMELEKVLHSLNEL